MRFRNHRSGNRALAHWKLLEATKRDAVIPRDQDARRNRDEALAMVAVARPLRIGLALITANACKPVVLSGLRWHIRIVLGTAIMGVLNGSAASEVALGGYRQGVFTKGVQKHGRKRFRSQPPNCCQIGYVCIDRIVDDRLRGPID